MFQISGPKLEIGFYRKLITILTSMLKLYYLEEREIITRF